MKISRGKLLSWQTRYHSLNQHNGHIPRHHQLLNWEKEMIISAYKNNSLDGYKRVTYLLMDEGKVFVSPASVYRVLIAAGIIRRKNNKISKKGTGFNQPLNPHEHWHTDITFIKIKSIFYYLILALDGYSRFIVSWDLLTTMTEADVELVIQKGLEAFPTASPRIISDNGSQFTAKEFKSFLNQVNLTHVTTSPYYPQSNGKLERCNKTIKHFLTTTCILDLEDGKKIIHSFIRYYNYERLHSSIGYVAPHDRLTGKDSQIKLARLSGLAQAQTIRLQFWNSQPSTRPSSTLYALISLH